MLFQLFENLICVLDAWPLIYSIAECGRTTKLELCLDHTCPEMTHKSSTKKIVMCKPLVTKNGTLRMVFQAFNSEPICINAYLVPLLQKTWFSKDVLNGDIISSAWKQ